MIEYADDFEWLNSIFHKDAASCGVRLVRDQVPETFAAYARIFTPIKINYPPPKRYRWDELARICRMELSADTIWDDLVHAIVSSSDDPLQHVGPHNVRSCAWDMPRAWRSVIGCILSSHDVSDEILYGVWDGYEIARSCFRRHGYFDLGTRGYHIWSGEYIDFGRFHAYTTYGRICPQDIAWPSSRSWFYRTDTDWTSGLIAGSHAMIASLAAASEVEILEIDGNVPSGILAEVSPTA